MSKLILLAIVACTAFLICLTINAQPKTGVVTGICVDSKTGEPIDGATVQMDLDSSSDGLVVHNGMRYLSRLPDLFSQIPKGWSENSQVDTDLDITGHAVDTKTHWAMVTDESGRFRFPNVTVGSYRLTADSTGHSNVGVSDVLAVSEGTNEPYTLTVDRSADSLSFDTPGKYWTTDEYPAIGLNGLLKNPTVKFTLRKIDVDYALKNYPKTLFQDEQATAASNKDGKLIREWTDNIDDADDEGSFYDRIHCFSPATGKPQPGVYELIASSSDDKSISATIIFDVTDLAVVTKMYGNKVEAHAVDIRTGKSISGANAYALAVKETSSKALSDGLTSSDGLCTLSTQGAASEDQGMILVRKGALFAAAEVNYSSPGDTDESGGVPTFNDPNAPDLRAFIYTDRPVYRPGQTVSLKGITRLYDRTNGFIIPADKMDLVVTDAQNTIISRQSVTGNQFGSWAAKVPLSTETLTGEYTVHEKIRGVEATGTFAVAAYHKPEYQVNVSFNKPRYIKGDVIVATITGTYYFGAPMSGASGSVEINKKDSAAGEVADDGSNSGTPVKSQDFVLDGNGQATITIDTNAKSDSQSSSSTDEDSSSNNSVASTADDDDTSDMTYTVSADLSDKSGTSVTSQSSVVVAQGDFSINASASLTVANIGDPITVTAQTVDQNSSPLGGKNLDLDASYSIWKDDEETYTSFSKSSVVTGKDGYVDFTIKPQHAGLVDVKFSSKDDRGNLVIGETQIWVVGKDSDIAAQYSDISILLDKSKYKPGDTAHVLITTSHPGSDAFVTVEGSTLYKTMVVPLTRRATEVDLPVLETYAPGITVAVNCVVNKQFLSSSADLAIDDPKRTLAISIMSDKAAYHPGDTATIHLHTADQSGHPVPAEISLAVVDSAIFAIMPEPADTIFDAFLPTQTDIVTTSDSTETVYYGDVDKGSTNIDIRRKFPDTALWMPDIVTDAGGNATVTLTLPDTLTTWRMTSYGITKSTMVGKGVNQFIVNKDLTVRLEAPTYLTNGDQSTLIAMVHNNTKKPLNVNFKLNPGGLEVTGDLTQTLVVNPGTPERLSWPVKARSTGNYSPAATVVSGKLNDGVQTSVAVYPHGASHVTWAAGTALYQATESVNLSRQALRKDSALTVRLSPTLASALPPAGYYLSSYPYGSTDSIVSALISNITLYQAAGPLNLSASMRADFKQKVQRCLLRLYREQLPDGGWGWFSTGVSDMWMTADAAYGITFAKQNGFPVNETILTAAVQNVSDTIQTEEQKKNVFYISESFLSLSAWVLAENGSPKDASNVLHYELREWSDSPLFESNVDVAMAARAEHAIGTPAANEEAGRLMAGLWSEAREAGAMVSWTSNYHSSGANAESFYPDADATASVMLAAEMITPADTRIDKAARWLAANRNDDNWCDVDTTATAIQALALYIGRSSEMTPNMTVTISVNGKPAGTAKFVTASIGDPDTVITIPASRLAAGNNIIELSKTGTGRLYYSIKLNQTIAVPSPMPPSSWIATAFNHLLHPVRPLPQTPSGYRVKRIYTRMTSRRNFLWEDSVPAPDWQFNNGDSILVRLIIDSVRAGSRIVIDEPVPPGFRIAETSGEFVDNWDNWWDYTDVRDSDIVFFVNDMTKGRHEIDYHLVAARQGEYDVMPTSITSMVDPTLQAVGTASKVEIDGN